MGSDLDKNKIEQEQRIRILEQENEFLSSKAEENQLLSRAFEEIYKQDDSDSIYTDILEHIAVLLDVQFAGVFKLIDNQLVNIKSYSLLDHDDYVREKVILSNEAKSSLFIEKSCLCTDINLLNSFAEILNFVPLKMISIPFKSEDSVKMFFLLANNRNYSSLQERIPLLEKIADITSIKLEKIYYREKLQKINNELENRVKERTEELTLLNEKLTNSLDSIKNINAQLEESKELAEENEKKFQLIMENSIFAIYSLNIETGTYDYLSPSIKDIYGYTADEFIQGGLKTSIERFHPEDVVRIEAHLNGLLDKELKDFSPTVEYRFLHPKKGYRWMSDTRTVVFDANNKPISLIGFALDINDKVVAQNKLKKAKEKAEEGDRLKTEFINNMSHEIRTPLNGIIGFSSFLENADLEEEERVGYVKIIQNSGKQLLRIIEDILEISRLGTNQVKLIKESVCINELITEQFSIFQLKANEACLDIKLNKELPDDETHVSTDKAKLRKIISNLIENALKYTNTGYIEIGCRFQAEKSNLLQIYVKDTGIGISQAYQKKIFERFVQEEQGLSRTVGGLGLGLSIAYENVKLLGGQIRVSSRKDIGSTFYVELPYSYSKQKEKNKNSIVDKIMQNIKSENAKILVVEDEYINYQYLQALLVSLDPKIEVVYAKNGVEAIEVCKTTSDIDIILMDIKMPIMNGLDATKEIRKIMPNVPIIAQTAYASAEDEQQAKQSGCDDYLAKPISQDDFNILMMKYLG